MKNKKVVEKISVETYNKLTNDITDAISKDDVASLANLKDTAKLVSQKAPRGCATAKKELQASTKEARRLKNFEALKQLTEALVTACADGRTLAITDAKKELKEYQKAMSTPESDVEKKYIADAEEALKIASDLLEKTATGFAKLKLSTYKSGRVVNVERWIKESKTNNEYIGTMPYHVPYLVFASLEEKDQKRMHDAERAFCTVVSYHMLLNDLTVQARTLRKSEPDTPEYKRISDNMDTIRARITALKPESNEITSSGKFPWIMAYLGTITTVAAVNSEGAVSQTIEVDGISGLLDLCCDYLHRFGNTAPDENTGDKRAAYNVIKDRATIIANRWLTYDETEYSTAYTVNMKNWQVNQLLHSATVEAQVSSKTGLSNFTKVSASKFQKSFLNALFAKIVPATPKKETGASKPGTLKI